MVQVMNISLSVASTTNSMAEEAAKLLVACAEKAIHERGIFRLALSGGSSPLPLFTLLASPAYRNSIDWKNIEVFWADERCVAPDHTESNYYHANKLLLSKVPAKGVYRMCGEGDIEKAATDYEAILATQFLLAAGELPRFDCIVLGIGTDGHTCSLFPHDIALQEKKRTVLPVYKTDGINRLTITFPVVNNARCCLFLAAGREKHQVISQSLNLMATPLLPAQRVKPHAGSVHWIIDTEAYTG